MSRAAEYGTIHLNRVFVRQGKPRRLWKTSVRYQPADIFWTALVTPFCIGFSVLFAWLISFIPGVGSLIHWWSGLIVSLPIAYVVGRRVSVKVNPYARDSGESLGSFLRVFFDRTGDEISWKYINRQRMCTVTMTSVATGSRRTVEAVVYIGTARAQDTPVSPTPRYADKSAVYLQLAPSSKTTNWVEQVSRKKARNQPKNLVAAKSGNAVELNHEDMEE